MIIKLKTITAVFIMCAVSSTTAQNSLVEFFYSPNAKLVWLGVDFSKAKYFGDPGTIDGIEMKNGFTAINSLILFEPSRYDIEGALFRKKVEKDIRFILSRNESVNEKEILVIRDKDAYRLTDDSVREVIRSYELQEDLSGIGFVFICEALDKFTEKGTFYVAVFNIETKEIHFIERVVGSAKGFGFRNHWATCIDKILNDIEVYKFEEWKKKYVNKKK